jgi:hydroxypyruvate reductase
MTAAPPPVHPVLPDGLPPEVAHTAGEAIVRTLGLCNADAAVDAWFARNELAEFLNLRVLAFGKASVPMARAALRRLEIRLSQAVVIVPPEWAGRLKHKNAIMAPADHPIPTGRNIDAARALASAAHEAREDEGVLVLISGGGSAHLTLPRSGVNLDEIRSVTQALLKAGAPIQDLNTVRRSLEQLKGGGLRAICPAKRVFGLVVSDVIGDDLSTIASGPLVAGEPGDPVGVLAKWGVEAPAHVLNVMRTPKVFGVHEPAHHEVLLSGQTLVSQLPAALAAEPMPGAGSIRVGPVVQPVTGEAAKAGADLAARFLAMPRPSDPDAPNALLAWGETTVTVGDAAGTGGRNLELALAAAIALPTDRPWALLTLATDGIDGPTDAAGAILCSEMFQDPRASTLARNALKNHDSYHAVEMLGQGGGLIRTGPTGTNLNDIALFWWRDA